MRNHMGEKVTIEMEDEGIIKLELYPSKTPEP